MIKRNFKSEYTLHNVLLEEWQMQMNNVINQTTT